ncbi:MAG: dihydrofolate reductase [Cyclobacteriaceae bacterium]|jgi:dihydrofolate reductase
MIISLIAAMSQNRVIGRDNDLPWKLPDDMKFFQRTTRGHVVIMGRKNYDSLPPSYKPLPNRTNVILTRQAGFQAEDCVVFNKLDDALEYSKTEGEQEAFVIGGGQIYQQALEKSDKIYLTEIQAEIDGDTFFPALGADWKEVSREHHSADERHQYSFDFVTYEKA